MKTTKLFLKYIVGAGNLSVHQSRIWRLTHDGTCEGFRQAWSDAETREYEDWVSFINEFYPDISKQITKVNDGLYRYNGLDVVITDIVILYKKEY